MDGHHGVARRRECPHGFVPKLPPIARRTHYGHDTSHAVTIAWPTKSVDEHRPVQCLPVRRPLLTLIALGALTFALGLGRQAITDADEAYYAEASREMVASGDWLTPHYNFTDRWQKPVLYYWLTAATYLVTGPGEGAARLWSALSGVALALLTAAAARRHASDADSQWLAGAIVATSYGYFAMAR